MAAGLIVIFISLNIVGIAQTIQVLNVYGFALNSGLGRASVALMATYFLRSAIAALYFLKVRWFYWILVASMLVVYLLPRFPVSLANTWLLFALVVVLGWSFAISQRQYLIPWRDFSREDYAGAVDSFRSLDGYAHERIGLEIALPETVTANAAKALFEQVGGKIDGTIFVLEAEHSTPWQADNLLEVYLYRDGRVVRAQDDFDRMIAWFPLAGRPAEDQAHAIRQAAAIADAFGGSLEHDGERVPVEAIQALWDEATRDLIGTWGAEPGSRELADKAAAARAES